MVRAQLNRVLADPRLVRSERHSRFLRCSVEKTLAGENDELKEYVIAVEVYGRPTSYDLSVDLIVRVDAARLRAELLEHYAANGRDDSVDSFISVGSSREAFVRKVTAEGSPLNRATLRMATACGQTSCFYPIACVMVPVFVLDLSL